MIVYVDNFTAVCSKDFKIIVPKHVVGMPKRMYE